VPVDEPGDDAKNVQTLRSLIATRTRAAPVRSKR